MPLPFLLITYIKKQHNGRVDEPELFSQETWTRIPHVSVVICAYWQINISKPQCSDLSNKENSNSFQLVKLSCHKVCDFVHCVHIQFCFFLFCKFKPCDMSTLIPVFASFTIPTSYQTSEMLRQSLSFLPWQINI